ncbi:FUSC family protein [Sanguibacter sp. 25GB23B1]|uniref:FUSC family protein n=1 Tax=unclassified Sanguibacter TaxID=2645534 RepID=UPI0032AF6A63
MATTADDDEVRVTTRRARASLQVRSRARQGRSRVRASAVPILVASIAVTVSYALAYWMFGHQYPFFAPVCAWICLGFTADRDVRRVIELGIGVTLGVGLGEVLVGRIGTGAWQIGLVLGLSALIARFIDRGALMTTQAGVQAIVIIGLPLASTGGGLGRWTDALVGAAVAAVATALTPGDPRHAPRRIGAEGLVELASTLDAIAVGVRTGDRNDRERALLRGRASEPALEEWQTAARSALSTARVTANGRKYRQELTELVRTAVLVDRTMRTVRVVARRAISVPAGQEVERLADLLDHLGVATRELAEDVAAGRPPGRSRELILEVAGQADPGLLGSGDWQVQSLILILRSAIVDLAEAAGVEPQEARDALAPM